jgi:hypothetical protein
VAVERTAQGIHRSGTVALLFPPAGHVGDGPALVEAEEINFVHGGAGCFYSNNLHALVQIALELKSEVNQLQHQIFFRRLIVCADIVHSKRVDGCGLGMTAIPQMRMYCPGPTLSQISMVSPGDVNPGPEQSKAPSGKSDPAFTAAA